MRNDENYTKCFNSSWVFCHLVSSLKNPIKNGAVKDMDDIMYFRKILFENPDYAQKELALRINVINRYFNGHSFVLYKEKNSQEWIVVQSFQCRYKFKKSGTININNFCNWLNSDQQLWSDLSQLLHCDVVSQMPDKGASASQENPYSIHWSLWKHEPKENSKNIPITQKYEAIVKKPVITRSEFVICIVCLATISFLFLTSKHQVKA